jgi:hypothetical protein
VEPLEAWVEPDGMELGGVLPGLLVVLLPPHEAARTATAMAPAIAVRRYSRSLMFASCSRLPERRLNTV